MAKPKDADKTAWIAFVNSECANCERPKGACTEWVADMVQARKCFEEWTKQQRSM